MSEMSTGTIIGFVIFIPVAVTSFVYLAIRLSPGPGAMFLKKMEDNAAPNIGVGGPLGGLPIPGGAALGGLAGGLPIPGGAAALTGLASKIPGGAALGGLSAGLASKIPIPGGAAALTGLASDKMPSNIEMSTFSKGDNPLTAMAANPLSAVAGGKLPDMSATNPLSAMAANKTNAVIAEQTADAEKVIAEQTANAEKAVAVNTKETERQLRLAAAEKRKKLEASIQVPDIIPSRVNNIISVGKDGTITQIPKLTGEADTSRIFTYGEGEGNVTNTLSSNNSNPVKKGGGKKTKSKRTKLTKVDSNNKKSVKREKKPRTKKCLIEKDNKMYMSFCI
jgi:hypothetical protein